MNNLRARAKRERWAREVNCNLLDVGRTIYFVVRHPRIAMYAFQLDLHAFLEIPPPPMPKMKVRL